MFMFLYNPPAHLLSPSQNLSKLALLHNKLICFDFFVISLRFSALRLFEGRTYGCSSDGVVRMGTSVGGRRSSFTQKLNMAYSGIIAKRADGQELMAGAAVVILSAAWIV
jgi:hypothetical protein